MKNKFVLIIPYFGPFPCYLDIFLNSIKRNKHIDFLLFTDNEIKNEDLENLTVIKMPFSELQELFQDNFDFKICLESPYKLCDFRPTWGVVFRQYLTEYDFWGHCDLDMVLGDISSFLDRIALDDIDKIYQHGHLSFYRNCEKVNNAYKLTGGMNYREVLSSPISFVFDEIPGIQRIFDNNGFKTFKSWDFFDANPWKYHLERVKSHVPNELLNDSFDCENECVFYENGKIFRAYEERKIITYEEMLYFHFQKRDYKVQPENFDCYYFTNEGTEKKIPGFNISIVDIKTMNKQNPYREFSFWFKKKKFMWVRRYKKYVLKKG